MDGVITKTALTHAHAWKKMFDDYIIKREKPTRRTVCGVHPCR
jgi:beta-phosphoglucomutase-like phosphatase (HAD superfamily)